MCFFPLFLLFFFNDTATTEIYTLSLHDALPIYVQRADEPVLDVDMAALVALLPRVGRDLQLDPLRGARFPLLFEPDRKSTRLNSSHLVISYAVFCLKKKKTKATRSTSDHATCAA